MMMYSPQLMNLMAGKRFLLNKFILEIYRFRFIGDARVRVTLARPRIRTSGGGGGGGGRRYFDSNKYEDRYCHSFFFYSYVFFIVGDVINVVVEDISVVIVVMNNEAKRNLAMDIGEFFY